MATLTVNTGPLKGRQYTSLLDYMDDQAEFMRNCGHEEKRVVDMITGKNTDTTHHVIGWRCVKCGYGEITSRQRVNNA